ncbi:MerR family transcriptional regulator [Aliarcobacter butzleri]|uniref:hypothetical protein n=1 Tax=Aliarcobacter butzleri TaxID=28197 RepID=UPI00126A5BEA|nr:hypothetical protein [Aliarcobacter butzleri]MCT7614898.1 helix-turn-helix domain-containing protein [Aliarcobacter butzleri]MCT7618153.1 helix-turn-helix domain-containing protein [Aliarcobacter butzleri]
MNEIELIFDKLYSYFNVATITELAQKLDMSQPAVTNWIRRNSISAIKKRCRELGIYNEIFGDLNSNINNFQNSNINKAFDLSSNSHSQDSINIGNNPICEQISKMNQTIVSSFINVYDKLERKGDLKRLHQILGEIEFE